MGTGGLRPTMWSNTSMIKDCGRGIWWRRWIMTQKSTCWRRSAFSP
jgi:hypothetical protein